MTNSCDGFFVPSGVNGHHHSVVAIDTHSGWLNHNTAPSSFEQLSPYFGTDALVTSCKQQV
jgi:hypothetical protein